MKFLDLAFSSLKSKKNIIVISIIILSVVLISTALFVWMQTNFVATLNDYYFAAKKSLLTPLGLSSLFYLIWAVTFCIIALKRTILLIRHLNLILSSFIILIASTAILSFFEPWNGILGYFTLEGEISLGGSLGSSLITDNTWIGISILVVLILSALSLAFPSFVYKFCKSSYKFALISTFFTITSSKYLSIYIKSALNKIQRANFPYQNLVSQQNDSSSIKTSNSNFELFETNPKALNSNISSKNLTTVVSSPESQIENQTSSSKLSTSIDSKTSKPETSNETSAITTDRFPSRKETHENLTSQPVEPKYNKFWNIEIKQNENINSNHTTSISENTEHINENSSNQNQNKTLTETINTGTSEYWDLPNINTLKLLTEGGITQDEIDATANTIRDTLTHNSVDVELGLISPGPTVTMYGLEPGWVVKSRRTGQKDEKGQPIFEEDRTRVTVDTILKRERDLALALKTNRIRIESPALGRSLVGIEVPNPSPSIVSLRSILESEEFNSLRSKASLPIALGKGTGGDTIVTDLAKMPHLLIAGATGSGKSILLNTLVSCLLMEKTPEELRLILIDPKRVELTPYNGVPHLLSPAIVEVDKVVGTLRGIANEMMKRYRTFEASGVRNIESYNKQSSEKMPMLLVVIDELADLMMTASTDVERVLCRLAQMGRATGIHLIIATQRPSVNVLTGLIKANFPTRISFTVTSQIDSRTILDTMGAEKLLGKGDMLYLPPDAMQPIRAQGTFISEKEIASIVLFWKTVKSGPMEQINLDSGDEEVNELATDQEYNDTDELFKNAVDLASSNKKLSTSLLQRKLRIGYPRAARLMDQLEDKGIVGPSDGSKSRDVII